MRPTGLKGAAISIAHSLSHRDTPLSLPLRCRSAGSDWHGPSRGSSWPNSCGAGDYYGSQDGRGGRGPGGDGGSPTQEICGGPASTDGENVFEGSAWNLDDDEEPDQEGPSIEIYNI